MVLIFLSALALISSYAFIGGGIKYLDQIIDLSVQPKAGSWSIWAITLGLVFITALWVYLDFITAIIAFALFIGLLAMRKIDNKYFIIIAVVVLPFSILSLLPIPLFVIIANLIPLVLAVITDEILHGLAPSISTPSIRWVFSH